MDTVSPESKVFEVTPEHEAIFESAQTGTSFAIVAGAGSGKTETSDQITRREPEVPTLYLAFNRSVAREALHRFASSVSVKTQHSLAYGACGHHYKNRLSGSSPWTLRRAIEDRFTRAWQTAGGSADTARVASFAAVATIVTFCQSADTAIDERHVPANANLDATIVAHVSRALWKAIVDVNESLPVLHDIYLKLYQLSKPRIRAKRIIYDEGQDANPAMLDIALSQDAQLIFIADPAQQIYAWRGAIDALDAISLPRLPLSASWRFGHAIANVANRILAVRRRDDGFRIVGRGGPSEVVERSDKRPNVILSRSNHGLVQRAVTYARDKTRIGLTKGPEMLCEWLGAAYDLWKYGHSHHPAFSFFASWNDFQEVAQTQLGAIYRQFIELVAQYLNDTPEIIRLLSNCCVDPATADIILSTLHSYKGLEADDVELSDDYVPFCREDDTDDRVAQKFIYEQEEANIAYVAMTRARRTLILGSYARVLDTSIANVARMREAERSDAAAAVAAAERLLETTDLD